MAELKTKPTDESVETFLNQVADPQRRADCFTVLKLMEQATGTPAKMWGSAIVGFGDRHLRYASGRELDWFQVGFSPRKQDLTLYLGLGGDDHLQPLLSRLGKHKTGKGCLYLKRLSDVDLGVLEELIAAAVKEKE